MFTNHPPLVFIDLETTGLNQQKTHIYEIGLVFIEQLDQRLPFNEVKKIELMINPQKPIHPLAMIAVNRWSENLNQKLVNKPHIKSILPKVMALLANRTIINHRLRYFDYPVLRNTFQRLAIKIPNMILIDTFVLARKSLPKLNNHSLWNLLHFFNIQYQESCAHHAAYDAYLAYLIYFHLLKLPTTTAIPTAKTQQYQNILTTTWIPIMKK